MSGKLVFVAKGLVQDVLDQLEVRATRVECLGDRSPEGNANWLVEVVGGDRVVLRRYHDGASEEDLVYEHAVLRHVADAGWVVPEPVGPLLEHDLRWYCLTRFVPGLARGTDDESERGRRGRDLAQLELALRDLGETIGQRPGWRPQHTAVTVHSAIEWDICVEALSRTHPQLAASTTAAAEQVHHDLRALPAADLPMTVVHGDFAPWNIHYDGGRLAGVVDFGLTHLDSRPYELAIARTHGKPEVVESYQAELARQGWPLTDLEVAAIEPLRRAFRIDMVAWLLDQGRRTGRFDTNAVEQQLTKACPAVT